MTKAAPKVIKAVCATQPGPNPGMASVDLALAAFCRRYFPSVQLEFHQLYSAAELMASRPEAERGQPEMPLPFAYRSARSAPEPLWDSDALLYWGDFLHMEHYQRTSGLRLVRMGAAPDEAAGRSRALDYYFLRNAPEAALARTLAFGGTLLFDRGLERCGEDYAQAFGRFMQGARGVWMREPYSALKVARERGTEGAPPLGCDASLLLDADTVAALPRTEWSADPERGRGCVGLFFGRSAMKLESLAGFGREIAQALGTQGHWLPWGSQHSFPLMQYAVRGPKDRPEPKVPATLGDALEFIARYRLVVTDTYHLCVNAWKLGVPAICIGQALPRTQNNVNSGWAFAWRDKRHTFYAQHDALDYYVYSEELAAQEIRDQRRGMLLEAVADDAMVKGVTRRVRSQAAAAERQLAAELGALL